MKLTKRHLRIFDLYEGKKLALENAGTQEEKELFRNGEFEKINELIETEFRIKQKELSEPEAQKYKDELSSLFDNSWNKKSVKYLSKKYYEPHKPISTFESIMDLLSSLFN